MNGPRSSYRNFGELLAREKEGEDFRIRTKDGKSAVLIMAPHGGLIEPGTSEIAKAIAGDEYSLYCFEGMKPGGSGANLLLHIPSTSYDEARAVAMLGAAETVVTIHGMRDFGGFVVLGGLHAELKRAVAAQLNAAGFSVDPPHARKFPALRESNICNRGRSGRGVQIEISRDIREPADPQGRAKFIAAVRKALKETAIKIE